MAYCYADQEISAITTYLNDNAQTPLNRFVVYMLYSQHCNKYSDKSNWSSLGLSLSVGGPSAIAELIVNFGCPIHISGMAFLRYGWGTQNLSRDVTTPLSGMVCRPSAGTSYRQPVHQIWSLYVNSLRRYEWRRKMQNLGWFWVLGVTQGHRKHHHLIEHIWLPIRH